MGSEEHQLGEEYHDPDLYDNSIGLMDSFKEFRNNMRAAKLDDTVVPIVSTSQVASRQWSTPLSMVFIDGGHSLDAAMTDYRSWASHIQLGGILAIHDNFPNPDEGGQAPYTIYKLAKAAGLFEELPMVNTLGLLSPERDVEQAAKNLLLDLRNHPSLAFSARSEAGGAKVLLDITAVLRRSLRNR